MRDLKKYAIECMEMLDSLGIVYGNVKEFTVNTRSLRRWGQCCKRPNGYYININADLLKEENSETGLKETILHELLHSCPDCYGHGERWQYYARKVNKAYGYNIKRTNSAEEKGVVERRIAKPSETKYQIQCPACKHIWNYQRKCNVVTHPEWHSCGKCNKTLIRIK